MPLPVEHLKNFPKSNIEGHSKLVNTLNAYFRTAGIVPDSWEANINLPGSFYDFVDTGSGLSFTPAGEQETTVYALKIGKMYDDPLYSGLFPRLRTGKEENNEYILMSALTNLTIYEYYQFMSRVSDNANTHHAPTDVFHYFLEQIAEKIRPRYPCIAGGISAAEAVDEFFEKIKKSNLKFCSVTYGEQETFDGYAIAWDFSGVIEHTTAFIAAREPHIYAAFYRYCGRYMLLCETGCEINAYLLYGTSPPDFPGKYAPFAAGYQTAFGEEIPRTTGAPLSAGPWSREQKRILYKLGQDFYDFTSGIIGKKRGYSIYRQCLDYSMETITNGKPWIPGDAEKIISEFRKIKREFTRYDENMKEIVKTNWTDSEFQTIAKFNRMFQRLFKLIEDTSKEPDKYAGSPEEIKGFNKIRGTDVQGIYGYLARIYSPKKIENITDMVLNKYFRIVELYRDNGAFRDILIYIFEKDNSHGRLENFKEIEKKLSFTDSLDRNNGENKDDPSLVETLSSDSDHIVSLIIPPYREFADIAVARDIADETQVSMKKAMLSKFKGKKETYFREYIMKNEISGILLMDIDELYAQYSDCVSRFSNDDGHQYVISKDGFKRKITRIKKTWQNHIYQPSERGG
ncbi:MAG: hypothetical protein LBP23_00645 [Treponema sp.]|jgi:hypothetical protein|nr:hypothetical protein [Treponema sp.]